MFCAWSCAASWDDRLVESGSPFGGMSRTQVLPSDSQAEQRVIGGMRVGRFAFNATWPLAALELHEAGLRVATRRLLKLMAVTWEALYEELIEVQAVGKIPLLTTGIRFRVKSRENSWVIFWCLRRKRVLQALTDRGVAVRNEPDRLHLFDPGRMTRET